MARSWSTETLPAGIFKGAGLGAIGFIHEPKRRLVGPWPRPPNGAQACGPLAVPTGRSAGILPAFLIERA